MGASVSFQHFVELKGTEEAQPFVQFFHDGA